MPRKKRVHLEEDGVSVGATRPACHPNVLTSGQLARTIDKTEVTCRNCQRLRRFRSGWPTYAELVELLGEIHDYLDANPLNTVGSRSVLHQKIISLLTQEGRVTDEQNK